MKKIITAFIFCFIINSSWVFGQNYFAKIFDFNTPYFSSLGKYCLNFNNDAFIITSYGYPAIVKIDSGGNILWSYYYANMGYPRYVKPTPDGGCTVMGTKHTFPYGIYILHVNSSGSIQWSKSYTSEGFGSFITTNDGGYMYLGNSPPFVVKFDSIGNIEWSKSLNASYSFQKITEVVQSKKGNYFAVGSFRDSASWYTYPMIWKIGSNGHSKSLTILKGFSINTTRINITPDNGFLIAGQEVTTNQSYDHTVLIKLNHKLHIKWSERIDTSYGFDDDWDMSDDVAVDSSNGNIMLVSQQRLVTLVDSSGNFLWNKALYCTNVSMGNPLSCFLKNNTITLGVESIGDGYLLFSADESSPPGCFFLNYPGSVTTLSLYDSVIAAPALVMNFQDSVISFTRNNLNPTTTLVCNPSAISNEIFTSSFYLFPNPANSSLTLSFPSSSSQTIELGLYNTLGKQIYVEKKEITKEKFEKEINVENWSDGIYFLQLKTKDENISRKVIINH